MKKVLTLIAFLIVASTAAYVYLQKKQSISIPYDIVITPTPAITQNITENWETYASPRFNYSFSYPKNWYLNAYDEANPEVLMGSHTLSNYDTNAAIKFSDHGIIDWEKFLGSQIVIKIDLSAQNLESISKEEFIENYFAGATLQPSSDLKFGNQETIQYNTPDAISNQFVRSYLAFPKNGTVIFASVYVSNQPNQVFLEDTNEWKELESIFASFEFK